MAFLSGIRMQCARLFFSTLKHNVYGQSGNFRYLLCSNRLGQNSILLREQALCKAKVTSSLRELVESSMGSPATTSFSCSARTAVSITVSERLKREDYSLNKHDDDFSDWKILVGSSDWDDHRIGKGAEKYRTHNLPKDPSCAGVYELGIVKLGREARKLDSSSVIPVYVGQAENIRNRLQQYGRDGAHLENGCSNASPNERRRLFSETFSRGYAIAYRWARMDTKQDAEITEKQLLDKFDYPWNKNKNDSRRDIFDKLELTAKASLFTRLAKNLMFFSLKRVGIRIITSEIHSGKNGSNLPNMKNNSIFSRTFRIKRLYPIPPVSNYNGNEQSSICGVSIGDRSLCTTPPVKGRKRCAEHKGMRVNGSISKLNTEEKSPSICGVAFDDGSICTTPPVKGRKRCSEHKGMRINVYISKLNTEGKTLPISTVPDYHSAGIENQGLNLFRVTDQECDGDHSAN